MAPRIDPRIATAKRVEVVPIDELRQWDRNPHHGNDARMVESIRRFGQVVPIVRAPDGWIISGNTTLRAMITEGYAQAAVVTLDRDEADQVAFGIAANAIGAQGDDDNALVLQLLSELDVLEGTGYDADSLADLKALVEEQDARLAKALAATSTSGEQGVASGQAPLPTLIDGYANKAVRSVVLDFPLPVFAWFTEHAEEARAKVDVETNADLMVRLVADLLGIDTPDGE